MGGLLVSSLLEIQSHKGPYFVNFNNSLEEIVKSLNKPDYFFIIDANVARIFAQELNQIIDHEKVIVITATEHNKSIDNIIPVIETLIKKSFRRNNTIVAIGGGIIQDISCFISSVLYRGVSWKFVPTTLLAQADSCIGSKSSINVGNIKNIIGTFNPPAEVLLSSDFLRTLPVSDLKSGVGEILKVHAIDSIDAFNKISNEYDMLLSDFNILNIYIKQALIIKKVFIEADEFDVGIRNIFNYGHSFGHAIETATNFAVPHGIAVSIGMDIANQVASWRGLISENDYNRMHQILFKNYSQYLPIQISTDIFFSALLKDKKNIGSTLTLILPTGSNCKIQKIEIIFDSLIKNQCTEFLNRICK